VFLSVQRFCNVNPKEKKGLVRDNNALALLATLKGWGKLAIYLPSVEWPDFPLCATPQTLAQISNNNNNNNKNPILIATFLGYRSVSKRGAETCCHAMTILKTSGLMEPFQD
jgi:hypothetical protein